MYPSPTKVKPSLTHLYFCLLESHSAIKSVINIQDWILTGWNLPPSPSSMKCLYHHYLLLSRPKKTKQISRWVLFFQVIRAMLQDYSAEKCFSRRLATAQWQEPNYGKHNPVKSCDFQRHSALQQKANINWKGGLWASHTAPLQPLTLPCSVYYLAVRRLCIHT